MLNLHKIELVNSIYEKVDKIYYVINIYASLKDVNFNLKIMVNYQRMCFCLTAWCVVVPQCLVVES